MSFNATRTRDGVSFVGVHADLPHRSLDKLAGVRNLIWHWVTRCCEAAGLKRGDYLLSEPPHKATAFLVLASRNDVPPLEFAGSQPFWMCAERFVNLAPDTPHDGVNLNDRIEAEERPQLARARCMTRSEQ